VLRRQFLLSTLVLVGIAVALLLVGVADATKEESGTARTIGAFLVVLGAMKVIRLTRLFWAILAADSLDRSAR
jgi:lysylphosphatidylglycerol synthetase-like protein (DUF2156 family)